MGIATISSLFHQYICGFLYPSVTRDMDDGLHSLCEISLCLQRNSRILMKYE